MRFPSSVSFPPPPAQHLHGGAQLQLFHELAGSNTGRRSRRSFNRTRAGWVGHEPERRHPLGGWGRHVAIAVSRHGVSYWRKTTGVLARVIDATGHAEIANMILPRWRVRADLPALETRIHLGVYARLPTLRRHGRGLIW